MLIREAVYADHINMPDLVAEFFDESLNTFVFAVDKDTVLKNCLVLIENYICIIAIEDDKIVGIIMGTVAPCDFNCDIIIATEIMWFVTKRRRNTMVGIKLFKKFEEVASERGSTHIAMGHMENLHPDKLKDFFIKQGYKPMQTQYIRSVK
jgi:hypothetical protein